MNTPAPHTVRLEDYRPSPFLIDTVDLDLMLHPTETRVVSRLRLRPNPQHAAQGSPLILDGETIRLLSVTLDGQVLDAQAFTAGPESLVIHQVPDRPFTLVIETTCNPTANTTLSGLYVTNGIYCTQCEAEGFRRITYYLDRPDVMARFTVRIEADKALCPLLLSNGNPRDTGDIAGTGRHFAIWEDPFPKPSYLFALVAGDLASLKDHFITSDGRRVSLGIHVERGKEDRCAWAMEALNASMKWDEDRFGLAYDLDEFNIVAVPDFNMGAMENKGLNIFNDKYILALPETATDADYVNIEAIIAHEYFHNWTGNRITCRDWFQLCLKEGLTVFRDQEFTSDLRSRAVKRIADVKTLRARQFPEDGGPLAHPVRPSSYIEINNFYTPTVYEKGAELCRMMESLIGRGAFRKGMDLYFARHDGEAATVEQFVACMADASGRDFTRFFRWYEQAGTPQVIATGTYDAASRSFTLDLEQRTRATPGQPDKQPLHMPLALGLVGPDGEDMPLDLEGKGTLNTPVIELTEQKQRFRFRNVASRPVLSLNRGFSAPVQITTNASAADQLFLMGHDRDSFNRWEAAQMQGRSLILAALGTAPSPAGIDAYGGALGRILSDPSLDDAYKAMMLGLPTESDIATAIGNDVDTDAVLNARDAVRRALGLRLSAELEAAWRATADTGAYHADPAGTARRALRYAALQLMVIGDPGRNIPLAMDAFDHASNMTAEMGTLAALVQVDCPERELALDQFYARHRHDHLLVDKWLLLNAQCTGAGSSARIERLTQHPDFRWTTPNKVYALIMGFISGNISGFNAADGSGYRVVADAIVKLNAINPQVAARLATGFRSSRVLDRVRRDAVQAELERIMATPDLSRDVLEIVSRIIRG